MKYKNILITGGAGFVGSNLAIKLKKKYPKIKIIVLDNLIRKGSELNVPRLKKVGIKFVKGDVRFKKDLKFKKKIDLLIECSAEPSVLAGVNESPEYLIDTNLLGAINCLELARQDKSDFLFLSTSRVYPIEYVNNLKFKETSTRFELTKSKGIDENFPLDKTRSLYGTTKLAAELFLEEYIETYGIRGITNRCGLITGPWQFGKVDQGIVVFWLANHVFNKELTYIGYGGLGKQVRDFIHIDDLFNIVDLQLNNFDKYNNQTFNIGGGVENSFSLLELTKVCQEITGNKVKINQVKKDRPNDIRIYLSDCSKFKKLNNWSCKKGLKITITDIYNWMMENKKDLEKIFL
jgi:CDP-paratose 2-epimerase